MSLSVRPYRPEDRAACALVFYRAVREGAAEFYSPAARDAWAPSPEPDWSEPDKLERQWCWVAERAGQVAGFMSLEPSGYLDMAFVLPGEMGRGTARALYAALVARARAAGMKRLWVTASHLARRFFLARGWRVVWMENLCADGEVYQVFRMVIDLQDAPHG